MIITHDAQYPVNPSNGQGWSVGPTISTDAQVPTGCPEPYAVKVSNYDMRIANFANFLPSRIGYQQLEVSGYAIAVSGYSTNLSIGMRYGTSYTNTLPNGYIGGITLLRANYSDWKWFKASIQGYIPVGGTANISSNMSATVSGSWWVAGLRIRKIQ